MQIKESDAKHLLRKVGIATPSGRVCLSAQEAHEETVRLGGRAMVKANVKSWHRADAGLIRACPDPESAAVFFDEIQAIAPGATCLVEELVQDGTEIYVALLIDDSLGGRALGCSPSGGGGIEEAGNVTWLAMPLGTGVRPSHVRHLVADCGIPVEDTEIALEFLHSLEDAFRKWDMRLLEINPLSWAPGRPPIALDAKMVVDDNALFRQPTLRELYEAEASESQADRLRIDHRIEYVELSGSVGLISGGAGMTMAAMDLLADRGVGARCFLDCSQNPTVDGYGAALRLLTEDAQTQSILVNVVGGGTEVDKVALVLAHLLRPDGPYAGGKPVVVRLEGTNATEAREILRQHGIPSRLTLEDAVETAADNALAVAS